MPSARGVCHIHICSNTEYLAVVLQIRLKHSQIFIPGKCLVPCILASALYEDVNEAQLPYFAWLGILLQGVVPPIHALIRAATRVTICGHPKNVSDHLPTLLNCQ